MPPERRKPRREGWACASAKVAGLAEAGGIGAAHVGAAHVGAPPSGEPQAVWQVGQVSSGRLTSFLRVSAHALQPTDAGHAGAMLRRIAAATLEQRQSPGRDPTAD
jgi:hypothetical protein